MISNFIGLVSVFALLGTGTAFAEPFNPSPEQMRMIIDEVSTRMRDPESTSLSGVVANPDPKIAGTSWVCGKVSGKNGFGGYGEPSLFLGTLTLNGEGKEFFFLVDIAEDQGVATDRLLAVCLDKLKS